MKRYLHRHSGVTRFNHWIMVILFGLAGFSGLALFHPNLFPLTGIFGGPQWTRIVHPYFGIGVFIAFLFMLARYWRDNLPTKDDAEWIKHSGDMLKGNQTAMPPVGKYNAGQKGVFWGVCICLIVLLVTGVLFWQAWFADSVPIPLQRLAVVLHALAAFIISLLVVIHIYAALWVKGTVRAMTQGTVSAGWAKQHHYLWYKKVTGGSTDRT
ncbi:formate dehydrogenase subunit gamma [Brachymonas denitrificans]|mgnify:FL=1|uniref:Formate dehydrogenase subunit gamma n=1 Tax=Brachymonas denitrificans DSM 15123 TaxID=1121117 RepID=A0A1H8IZ63_9BURK|nr:formate dehydrogenase subunit gamma [Brachymonas denitrificans]SEN73772.1 formate dehydrogenase subunit gamma [Brachymonas denitrificans DSM 15123]